MKRLFAESWSLSTTHLATPVYGFKKIVVYTPKVEVQSEYDLAKKLELGGVATNQSAQSSNVDVGVFFKMDKDGVSGGAYAMAGGTRGGRPTFEILNFDRPFLAIVVTASGRWSFVCLYKGPVSDACKRTRGGITPTTLDTHGVERAPQRLKAGVAKAECTEEKAKVYDLQHVKNPDWYCNMCGAQYTNSDERWRCTSHDDCDLCPACYKNWEKPERAEHVVAPAEAPVEAPVEAPAEAPVEAQAEAPADEQLGDWRMLVSVKIYNNKKEYLDQKPAKTEEKLLNILKVKNVDFVVPPSKLIHVLVQNQSDTKSITFKPQLWIGNRDETDELCKLTTLKPKGLYVLPYPLEMDKGEDDNQWVLTSDQDAEDAFKLTFTFKV